MRSLNFKAAPAPMQRGDKNSPRGKRDGSIPTFPTRLQVLRSQRIPNSNSFSRVIFKANLHWLKICQDLPRFAKPFRFTLSRPCSLSLTKPTKLGLCSRLVVLQWIGICGGLRDAKPLKYSLSTPATSNSPATHQVSQVLQS